jgi:hypothetical protein
MATHRQGAQQQWRWPGEKRNRSQSAVGRAVLLKRKIMIKESCKIHYSGLGKISL